MFFAVTVIGCKKFVNIPPPTTQIVTENVFTNSSAATAAMTSIYSQMENAADPYSIALDNGLLADELTNYSTDIPLSEFYENAMLAKDIGNPWEDAYSYIYQANAVINGLNTYSGIPASVSSQLIGEAEFTRAFWYFYLTESYGPVPLAISTNYTINSILGRSSQSSVYQQIIADLKDAENKLSVNYVDETDTVLTNDRVRPNRWTAAALLARAYLYTASFDSAEQQASLVINNSSLYGLCSSLDSVFLQNSREAIWQIPPPQPSSAASTTDGNGFILTSAPQTGGTSNVATISPQLLGTFENNDNRVQDWIGVFTTSNMNYYFPYKYKVNQLNATGTATEYTMVLRLAEQILIRAEARVQQGDLSDAILDLNLIRNRAGLAAYSGPTSKDSILSSILHERQVELFTEWGNRWFDLKRTNMINSVMSIVTPAKGGTWNTAGALFPVPLSEMSADPNLGQNPGY